MADPSAGPATAATRQQTTSPPNATSSTSAPRVRRRNRVIASCLECRRRKLKCDKGAPCVNCTKFRRDCLYLAPALDSASQQKLAEIKDRMGTLEQSLERDVARRASADKNASIKVESDEDEEDDFTNEFATAVDLEPTPFAELDQVYADDADDDLMDLGVQLGKMRVSERIGGFFRPKFSEELGSYPDRGNLGPQPANAGPAQNWLLSESPAAYLGPGPDYIAPASGFFFPSGGARGALQDHLPTKPTCDILMQQYWKAVHPIVTIVHKPTFLRVSGQFWQYVTAGTEPPASMQSVVFAALFNAAVSLSDNSALTQFGVPRAALVERMQSSTEASLSKANFLRTTKLEVMQSFVMYLVPLCRAEVSRAHSALTGTAIRLAECMGLHRDGSMYGFSAVETHVRRLIWYHLCFLDIRTVEATGPRPQIHKEEFDTKLPLNVNEEDLMRNPPPTEDSPGFTDMTLSRLRFETYEMHRQVQRDLVRIDAKQLKLKVALSKVQKFKTEMEARYLPLFDGSDPRANLALHVWRIAGSRLHTMLLHRYLIGTKSPMPDRLRRTLIDAILATNEFTISLDTRPELSQWAWYRGALLQYHSALLILFEVYANPNTAEAPRIWKCLDYIFELPPHMTGEQKADSVIFALRDRLSIYQSMRKMRASNSTEEAFENLSNRNQSGILVAPIAEEGMQGMGNMGGIAAGSTRVPDEMMGLNFQTTAQMDVTQFSMPPLQPATGSGSEGGGSQQGGFGQRLSPMESGMGSSSDEIDWGGDWDTLFPAEGSFGTANLADFSATPADLADFSMGSSWTAYPGRFQPIRRTAPD